MSKSFYNNKGPLKILDILKTLNLKDNSFTEDIKVFDVKDLFALFCFILFFSIFSLTISLYMESKKLSLKWV